MTRFAFSATITVLCALSAAACISAPPTADNTRARPTGTARSVRELERLHQPGAKHRALQGFVGEWDVALEGPVEAGGPLLPAGSGTATVGWTLEGRFLEMRGSFEFGGKRLESVGYVGYDTTLDLYQGIWLDDLNTGMTLMNGDGDPRGAGLVLEPTRRGIAARKRMRILEGGSLQIDVLGIDARGGEVIARRATYSRR